MRTWMAAAALALAVLSAAQQIDPNKVIATVNGEQILGSEYYHRMEFLQGVTMTIGGQAVESTPGFFTIAQLIGEHLLYQLAKQKGVLPTSQEIDNEIQLRMGDDPKFVQDMTDRGLSNEDIRDIVKHDLTNFKLLTAGITVTDQEVQDHYKKNPSQFTNPKKLHIRLIAVKTDADTKAVDAELKAGKNFSDVAKERSIDVTKAMGGDMGVVPMDYFAGAVQQAIGTVKIGETTGWIPVGSDASAAKVKYQVVDITPAKLQPLTKQLLEKTRRLMMLDESQGKVDLNQEISDLRAKSKVTITQPQFQELWQQLNGIGS